MGSFYTRGAISIPILFAGLLIAGRTDAADAA